LCGLLLTAARQRHVQQGVTRYVCYVARRCASCAQPASGTRRKEAEGHRGGVGLSVTRLLPIFAATVATQRVSSMPLFQCSLLTQPGQARQADGFFFFFFFFFSPGWGVRAVVRFRIESAHQRQDGATATQVMSAAGVLRGGDGATNAQVPRQPRARRRHCCACQSRWQGMAR